MRIYYLTKDINIKARPYYITPRDSEECVCVCGWGGVVREKARERQRQRQKHRESERQTDIVRGRYGDRH